MTYKFAIWFISCSYKIIQVHFDLNGSQVFEIEPIRMVRAPHSQVELILATQSLLEPILRALPPLGTKCTKCTKCTIHSSSFLTASQDLARSPKVQMGSLAEKEMSNDGQMLRYTVDICWYVESWYNLMGSDGLRWARMGLINSTYTWRKEEEEKKIVRGSNVTMISVICVIFRISAQMVQYHAGNGSDAHWSKFYKKYFTQSIRNINISCQSTQGCN